MGNQPIRFRSFMLPIKGWKNAWSNHFSTTTTMMTENDENALMEWPASPSLAGEPTYSLSQKTSLASLNGSIDSLKMPPPLNMLARPVLQRQNAIIVKNQQAYIVPTSLNDELNRPFAYRRQKVMDTAVFQASSKTQAPSHIGGERFYYLKKSLLVLLNHGNSLNCYLTLFNAIGLRSMVKSDAVGLNSITYDLSVKKKLKGCIQYMDENDYNFFQCQPSTRMFDSAGQLIDKYTNLVNLSAKICLAVDGLSSMHKTYADGKEVDVIRPLLRVYQIKLCQQHNGYDDVWLGNDKSEGCVL